MTSSPYIEGTTASHDTVDDPADTLGRLSIARFKLVDGRAGGVEPLIIDPIGARVNQRFLITSDQPAKSLKATQEEWAQGFDTERGNTDRMLINLSLAGPLTGAANNFIYDSGPLTNHNGRAGRWDLKVRTLTGTTPSLIMRIQKWLDGPGEWVTVISSAAVTAAHAANNAAPAQVGPGLTSGAGVANAYLTRTYRVVVELTAGTGVVVAFTIDQSLNR